MDNSLYGFDGDLFTLVVGEEQKHLSVPRGTLQQISHFRQALDGDTWIETRERKFDLVDLDPRTVATVMYYVHAGRVEKLDADHNDTKEMSERTKAHIRAFILADRWGAEAVANALLNELADYHKRTLVNPELIAMLSSANLCESPLYEFLAAEMAFDMQKREYMDYAVYATAGGNEEYGSDFQTACAVVPSEDLAYILEVSQAGNLDVLRSKGRLGGWCYLHKHVHTEECKPKQSDRKRRFEDLD